MSLRENLQVISASIGSDGMDIVIVSTTSPHLETYWQNRLMLGRGQVCKPDACVLVVHEDWEGGAGNGLGTLYALQKAGAKAKALFGLDLMHRLHQGAAVAVYHTAGKGTRLAPLPGCEQNNKPGVKLPGLVKLGDRLQAMTILEAVIRQTALYARSRKGRVSVFWGDQIFISTRSAANTPTHHADILARLGAMPDAATWEANGLHKYGLIAVAGNGNACQVEKVSHAEANTLIQEGIIKVDGGIGVSLGSFSMSAQLTDALLVEFAEELRRKSAKMDTDPHFWMPLTLDRATYLALMQAKGIHADEARSHYQRMQRFHKRFYEQQPHKPLFGCTDIGNDCLWWDYGQLPYYVANNRKLTGNDAEAAAMRQFMQVETRQQATTLGDVDMDADSIVLNCQIAKGRIRQSVLIGVEAECLQIDNAVLVNSHLRSLTGSGMLLYNVDSPEMLHLDADVVCADAVVQDRRYRFTTTINRDGGQDWEHCLEGNPMSYADLHKANRC